MSNIRSMKRAARQRVMRQLRDEVVEEVVDLNALSTCVTLAHRCGYTSYTGATATSNGRIVVKRYPYRKVHP